MSIAEEIAAIEDRLPAEIGEILPLGGKLISVILTVGGRAGPANDAIESVLAQTYRDWELIIADDGSAPEMAEMIAPYLTDRRIRHKIFPAKNAAAARNAGVKQARGRLIAYLDSGNVYAPRYLSAMAGAFARGRVRSAYAAMLRADADRGAPGIHFTPFSREYHSQGNFIDLNVFMHRRSLFRQHGGFDEASNRMTGQELILRYTETRPAFPVPVIGAHHHADASAVGAQENFPEMTAEVSPLRELSRPFRVLYALPARHPRIEIDIETEFLAMQALGVQAEIWAPGKGGFQNLAPKHGGELQAAIAAFAPDILHVHGAEQAALLADTPIPITVRDSIGEVSAERLRILLQNPNIFGVYVRPELQRALPQIAGLRAFGQVFNTASFAPAEKSRLLVFSAATASPGKDFNQFLEISKLLPEHLCVLALLETGGESCLKEVLALRRRLQAPTYILPNLPHGQVADWMGRAAIYLHAGREDSGLPLAVAEAMASGCHIFMPDTPSFTAILGDAGTGFDSAEDAATRIAATLADNAETWARLARCSTERAWRQFSGTADFSALQEDWVRILMDIERKAG